MPVSRLISACAAAFAIALTPAAATAATELGSLDGPELGWDACASPCALTLPEAIEAPGVVTRILWPATGTASSFFGALRPGPGGWSFIEPAGAPVGVNTVEEGREIWARIPVQPGDRIAVRRGAGQALSVGTREGTAVEGGAFAREGDVWQQVSGAARAPRLRVRIEPDVDADGYGDESQDLCVGAPGPRCDGNLSVVELGPESAPFGPAVDQRWQVTNSGSQPVEILAAVPTIDPNTQSAGPTVSIDGIWCPPTTAASVSEVLGRRLRVREGSDATPAIWRSYDSERGWRPRTESDLPFCGARALGPGQTATVTLHVPELTLASLAGQPSLSDKIAGPISTSFKLWANAGIPAGGRPTMYTRTRRGYERAAYSGVAIERKLRKGKLEAYVGCSQTLIEGQCRVRFVLSEPKGRRGAAARKHGRTIYKRTLELQAGEERKLRVALPARLLRPRELRLHWRTENELSTFPEVVFRLKSAQASKVKTR